MATETDVWADVYGHPVKVGTATAADENGARIVKISEEFDEAPFTNMRFQDDVDAAANAPAVEEPVGIVEVPVEEAPAPTGRSKKN